MLPLALALAAAVAAPAATSQATNRPASFGPILTACSSAVDPSFIVPAPAELATPFNPLGQYRAWTGDKGVIRPPSLMKRRASPANGCLKPLQRDLSPS